MRVPLTPDADPRTADAPPQGGSLTTVLHVACYWLEVDIVRLLLAHGSDHSSLDAVRRCGVCSVLFLSLVLRKSLKKARSRCLSDSIIGRATPAARDLRRPSSAQLH